MHIECETHSSRLRVGDEIVAVGDTRLPRPVWVSAPPRAHGTSLQVPYTRHEPSRIDLNLYLEDSPTLTLREDVSDDLGPEAIAIADKLRAIGLRVHISRLGERFAIADTAFADCVVYCQEFAVHDLPRGVYVEWFYDEQTDTFHLGARPFGAVKAKITRVMRRYRSPNPGAEQTRKLTQGFWGEAWVLPVPQPSPCSTRWCVYREGHDTSVFPHRGSSGTELTTQHPVP